MKEQCPFNEAMMLDGAAENTTAQCPECGAYRSLINVRVSGESTECYRFPKHQKTTRQIDRPSWRRNGGLYTGPWKWHTVEYHVTIEHR
jgi:hypothetical protein